MSKSEAQKFVTKAKSFGTLDFALLNKDIQPLHIQKEGGFPITPMMIVVGVSFILTIIAGILFACKLRQVGLACSALTSTVKAVTKQIPISKFHNLFQRHRPNKPQWQPETGIKLQPVNQPRDPCGPTLTDNQEDPTISSLICSAFGSEWDMHRYTKWLETKAAVQWPMGGHRFVTLVTKELYLHIHWLKPWGHSLSGKNVYGALSIIALSDQIIPKLI